MYCKKCIYSTLCCGCFMHFRILDFLYEFCAAFLKWNSLLHCIIPIYASKPGDFNLIVDKICNELLQKPSTCFNIVIYAFGS